MGVNQQHETAVVATPQEQTIEEPQSKSDESAQQPKLESVPLTESLEPVSTPVEPITTEPTTPTPTTPNPEPVPQSSIPNEENLQLKESLAVEKQKSASLQALLEAQSAKATNLEKVVQDQNAVLTLLNAEVSQLKADQNKPRPDPQQLATIETLRSDNTKLKEEITTHKTLLGAEIEKSAVIENDLAKKTKELDDLKTKNEQLEATHSQKQLDHQNQITKLKEENDKEKKVLAAQIEAKSGEIEELKAANAKLAKQLEEKSNPQVPAVTDLPPAPPIPVPAPPAPPPPATGHPFAPANQTTPPPPPADSPFAPAPPPPPAENPFAPTATSGTPKLPTVPSPTGGSLPAPPPPPPPSGDPFK